MVPIPAALAPVIAMLAMYEAVGMRPEILCHLWMLLEVFMQFRMFPHKPRVVDQAWVLAEIPCNVRMGVEIAVEMLDVRMVFSVPV